MSYLYEETAAPSLLTDMVSSESPAIASGEFRPTLVELLRIKLSELILHVL